MIALALERIEARGLHLADLGRSVLRPYMDIFGAICDAGSAMFLLGVIYGAG